MTYKRVGDLRNDPNNSLFNSVNDIVDVSTASHFLRSLWDIALIVRPGVASGGGNTKGISATDIKATDFVDIQVRWRSSYRPGA